MRADHPTGPDFTPLTASLALHALAALTFGAATLASPPLLPSRAAPSQAPYPAQSSPVPPIATCAPPPPGSSPTPPGLYPFVSVDFVVINQIFDAADCPSAGLYLQIRLRNDGPAPSGPFAVRIEGCGVGRREVAVEGIDMFSATTVTLPDPSVSVRSCAIMLDPACNKAVFVRHWTGPVPVPRPQPTCTPRLSPPATATESTGTATVAPATATEGPEDATATPQRLHLPRLVGMVETGSP